MHWIVILIHVQYRVIGEKDVAIILIQLLPSVKDSCAQQKVFSVIELNPRLNRIRRCDQCAVTVRGAE